MSKRKPKIVWSTVQIVGPMVPVPADVEPIAREDAQPIVEVAPGRLVIEGGVARPDRRGHSPIAQLLAGASMKAKANGVLYRHEQICDQLEPGLAVLAYALGLAWVAMSPKEKWSARGAYVIGVASAELEQQRCGSAPAGRSPGT
jgi:hypothetical protein